MANAYATRLAPATIDRLILAGLREQRGPVEEAAIPDLCQLRYQTLPADREHSLQRLERKGLIASGRFKRLDPKLPLLSFVDVTIYWATEGGDR